MTSCGKQTFSVYIGPLFGRELRIISIVLPPQKVYTFPLTHKRDKANSIDPKQTPQNAASDQGLHCLH